jgi:hypothetical protein
LPIAGQGGGDGVQVEAEPRARALTEAHGTELVGVRVDPAAVDGEPVGDRGRIYEARGAASGRRGLERGQHEFGRAPRDRLDVVGVQSSGSGICAAPSRPSRQPVLPRPRVTGVYSSFKLHNAACSSAQHIQ